MFAISPVHWRADWTHRKHITWPPSNQPIGVMTAEYQRAIAFVLLLRERIARCLSSRCLAMFGVNPLQYFIRSTSIIWPFLNLPISTTKKEAIYFYKKSISAHKTIWCHHPRILQPQKHLTLADINESFILITILLKTISVTDLGGP
jgi:hypothetical protein